MEHSPTKTLTNAFEYAKPEHKLNMEEKLVAYKILAPNLHEV